MGQEMSEDFSVLSSNNLCVIESWICGALFTFVLARSIGSRSTTLHKCWNSCIWIYESGSLSLIYLSV